MPDAQQVVGSALSYLKDGDVARFLGYLASAPTVRGGVLSLLTFTPSC